MYLGYRNLLQSFLSLCILACVWLPYLSSASQIAPFCHDISFPIEVPVVLGNVSALLSAISPAEFSLSVATIVFGPPGANSPLNAVQLADITGSQSSGTFYFNDTVINSCDDAMLRSYCTDSSGASLILTGDVCDKSVPWSLALAVDSKGAVWLTANVSTPNADNNLNALVLSMASTSDEVLLGLGLQYSRSNLKGSIVPVFSQEQGVGRGLQPVSAIMDALSPGAAGDAFTSYSQVPLLLSSQGFGIFAADAWRSVWDLSGPNTTAIFIPQLSATFRLFVPGDGIGSGNGTFLELAAAYSRSVAGPMQPLPDWISQGALLGLEGGTAAVLAAVDQAFAWAGADAPLAGVWLQDWTGQRVFTLPDLPRVGLWWNWELDATHYPDWDGMVASLAARGVAVTAYINPMLVNVSARGTPFTRNLYAEALAAGYLVRTGCNSGSGSSGSGSVWVGYSNASLVDLRNPAAVSWLTAVIQQQMLAVNISGWMADFGEAMPLDACPPSTHAGALGQRELRGQLLTDVRNAHGDFPRAWAALNRAAVSGAAEGKVSSAAQFDTVGSAARDSPARNALAGAAAAPSAKTQAGREPTFFLRSMSAGSPGVASGFWMGDQLVTYDGYDGLSSALTGMLTGALSGAALVHADIGGYTTLQLPGLLNVTRSAELLARSAELAAFSLLFRSHPGSLPSANWQPLSDEPTARHFFAMARLYRAWAFYRSQLMAEHAASGMPILRHTLVQCQQTLLPMPPDASQAVSVAASRRTPSTPQRRHESSRTASSKAATTASSSLHGALADGALDRQFFVGDEILVIPALAANVTSVAAFIPPGLSFQQLWTNATLSGGAGGAWIDCPAPTGQPCVLLRLVCADRAATGPFVEPEVRGNHDSLKLPRPGVGSTAESTASALQLARGSESKAPSCTLSPVAQQFFANVVSEGLIPSSSRVRKL